MFAIGERVRTKLMNPPGHTRLPSYLRGRSGRIVWALGTLPFSDRRAAGDATAAQLAYTVCFDAADLWGADAEPRSQVCADLFESYLEAE
ncbi:MAG TPA: SH3-like domain-containing protein [Candidatus Elarobacter sp.]